MQSTVQSILLVLLPLLGLILPGVLKNDHYTPQTNTIISALVVSLASVATAYAYDQFGPNLFRDAALVFTGMEVLLQGKLKPLDAYLQSNVFTRAQQSLPAIEQAVTALSAPTTQSSALIHITANTVHIPATAPTMSPVVPDSQITSANIHQVATQAIADVTPVADPVEGVQESTIVPDVMPVATGITTPAEANEKTQKIAVVKATTSLAG